MNDDTMHHQLSPSRKLLYDSVVDRGFAMLCTGSWLGVMVAPEKYVDSCPPSWAFLPIEIITEELFDACMDWSNKGHWEEKHFTSWPPPPKATPKKYQNMDEEERKRIYFESIRNDEYFGDAPAWQDQPRSNL